jgi:hypothetical protein
MQRAYQPDAGRSNACCQRALEAQNYRGSSFAPQGATSRRTAVPHWVATVRDGDMALIVPTRRRDSGADADGRNLLAKRSANARVAFFHECLGTGLA